MHILILAQRVPFPPNKGEKLRTFHQLEYLQRQGFTISLIAPYVEDSELQYFEKLKQKYCENIITHKLRPKYLSLPLGFLKGQSLSVANFYHNHLQVKLEQLLQEVSFDSILCSASSLAEYIFQSKVLKQVNNKPQLIMDFMDLDSDKWRQYAEKSPFPMSYVYSREHKLLSKFEKKIADNFDHCFFITQSEINLFELTHPSSNNIHAIENGLDRTMFFPPEKHRQVIPPVFLFAGVMDYPPNIDAVTWFVSNVWPLIIDSWPDAKFYIAGMNPTDKILQLSKQKGIEVTGFVEDIKPYFDQANVFVAPFRIARGVQNKILQAFACGLPVIASSMGAEGINYQSSEDILLADTPEAFMQQITLLINDKALYDKLSDNALQNIKNNYSWDSKLAPLKALVTTKDI